MRDLVLRRQALPDLAALDRFGGAGGEVAGVLVGHTHFDHAVDAPAIASRFGCKAYGSGSLLNLMALHGLAESTVVVEPYRPYELGPFVVRFTPSAHSKCHRQPGRPSRVRPLSPGSLRRGAGDPRRELVSRRGGSPRTATVAGSRWGSPAPSHIFFRPLGRPLEFVSNVQLSELPAEIGAISKDIELAALPRSDL